MEDQEFRLDTVTFSVLQVKSVWWQKNPQKTWIPSRQSNTRDQNKNFPLIDADEAPSVSERRYRVLFMQSRKGVIILFLNQIISTQKGNAKKFRRELSGPNVENKGCVKWNRSAPAGIVKSCGHLGP